MRAKEQITHVLCETIATATDQNFICFCGDNKTGNLESCIRSDDSEKLKRIQEVILLFSDYINNGK